jgi:C_GCAxxG_C_C family probable redox protein
MQEAFNVSTGVDARPALALGGGVCSGTDVCGAVSGGAVAIGQFVGDHVTGDVEAAKAKARELALPYRKDFEAKFGHDDCLSLTGHDHGTAEGRAAAKASGDKDRVCVHLVVYAVRRLLPLADTFA